MNSNSKSGNNPFLFDSLKFIYPWRNYQHILLENFTAHIADDHFHIIAPPGSGKTILGIEIIRRLGKKALVLSPTLIIRNQWENRLQNFFIDETGYTDFSFDLKAPSNLTFSTYQALHSFYKTFKNKESYHTFFRDHGVEVLVFDEAHHLKNEWWKCLFSLKESSSYSIVALTATPPYDSSALEIHKYFKLCGEIDDEIATPSLVKEKDLCPHQDYIYFSKPSDVEINYIYEYRKKIAGFIDRLKTDHEFITFVKSHRFYINTESILDEIYSNPDYFSAILIFLNASGNPIPFDKFEVLGFEREKEVKIPKLNNDWIEILFHNMLIDDRENLIENEAYLHRLEQELRKLNIFEDKAIDLTGNKNIYKALSGSPEKLKAITKIINHENACLKDDLRCVVLTDFIRSEFLDSMDEQIGKINRIGVAPIFQNLRISIQNKPDLAILTGSLVVIHAALLAEFNRYEAEENYILNPLICDAEYISIEPKGRKASGLVTTITKLFETGKIKVLIGTKSLLGEGWDAPAINTLVLASFVGSFVTSNQMRGRAIRVQKSNPHKTGNIWHLASVDPSVVDGGKDIAMLKRRFDAFLGISNGEQSYVSSGINRLNLLNELSFQNIDQLNSITLDEACNRDMVREQWQKAVETGKKLGREITLFHQDEKPYQQQKELYFKDVVKYLLAEVGIVLSVYIPEFILRNLDMILSKGVLYFFYALITFLTLNFGKKTYKAIKLYIHYGMIHKKIQNIGMVVINTMDELGYLTSDRSQIKVEAELLPMGDINCSIFGANQIESTLFINILDEILQPVENPRYLLMRSNWLRKKLDIENYFPVPEIFGDKKEKSLVFQKHWNKLVSQTELLYTRHFEGRKVLLKARLFHAKNEHQELTKKSVIWR